MYKLNDRTKFAIKLARGAGEILRKYYEQTTEMDVLKKGKNDVVTTADFEVEKYIIENIKKYYKEDEIISEEKGKVENLGKVTWIIDPLDGTVNFSTKLPNFAVSIAYMEKGIIIGAAVYAPIFDMMFYSETSKGAYLNDERIYISKLEDISNAICATDYCNRDILKLEGYLTVYEKLLRNTRNVIKLESAVLNGVFTACSKFDMFFETFVYIWDVAATSLILKEAGAKVTSRDGSKLIFDKISDYTIVAANEKLHGKLLDIVKE